MMLFMMLNVMQKSAKKYKKSFIHPCYFIIKKYCIMFFYMLYCIQWGDKKSIHAILQLDLDHTRG